jgi:hypothetical protein
VDAVGRVRGVVVGDSFVPKDPRFQLDHLGSGTEQLYEFPTLDRSVAFEDLMVGGEDGWGYETDFLVDNLVLIFLYCMGAE